MHGLLTSCRTGTSHFALVYIGGIEGTLPIRRLRIGRQKRSLAVAPAAASIITPELASVIALIGNIRDTNDSATY